MVAQCTRPINPPQVLSVFIYEHSWSIYKHTRKSLGGSKTDVVGVGVVTAAMKCTNGLSLQVQSDSFVLLYMRFRLLDILVFNI